MRSIWPLLQQLPTSFEHEGAKRPILRGHPPKIETPRHPPRSTFHAAKLQNPAILNPALPLSIWTSIMDSPKTHNHHHHPRPDSLGPTLFGRGGAGRQTDRLCGARDHDTLAHSLVSKSGHGRKNVAVRASTSPEHHLSSVGGARATCMVSVLCFGSKISR